MMKLFSTGDVHPRDRFDYWHSVACNNLVGHSSTPECRQTFAAEIETGMLADIELVLFENSPMNVARTAKHIAQSQGDELFVCRQAAGLLALEQDGRQLVLGAGDVTLLDPLLPYGARFSGGSKLLVVKVPRRELAARIGKIREMIAIALKPSEAGHRWTSSSLAMLPNVAGRMTPAAEEVAKNQILDLIAVSLLNARGSLGPCISSARSVALLNVRAVIESRLSDPHLNATSVAQAAGVSIRYANALLAEENSSIMRLVLAMRLARCRQALEDPLQDNRTVSEIAYGWGFSDMTHFGRRFKAMYDVSPRDYRKSATSLRRGAIV
jgi:AraC family transcriptional activator of tynA and feaB